MSAITARSDRAVTEGQWGLVARLRRWTCGLHIDHDDDECDVCHLEMDCRHGADEIEALRTVVGRLLDGWVVGDNCDPDTPDGEEWAWERTGIVGPGSFLDEREPFEDGVDAVLRAFDPPEEADRG